MMSMEQFHFTSTKENLGNKRLLISQIELKFLDDSGDMLVVPKKYLLFFVTFSASKQALSEQYDKIITFSLTSKWNLYIKVLDLIFVFKEKNLKSLKIISPRKAKSQKSVELFQLNSNFKSNLLWQQIIEESKDDLPRAVESKEKLFQTPSTHNESKLELVRIEVDLSKIEINLDEKAFKYLSFILNYYEFFKTLSTIKARKRFNFEIKNNHILEKNIKDYFLTKKLEVAIFKNHKLFGDLTREICLIKIYKEIYPLKVLHLIESNLKTKDFLFGVNNFYVLNPHVAHIIAKNLKNNKFNISGHMKLKHLFEILEFIESNEFGIVLIKTLREFLMKKFEDINYMDALVQKQLRLNKKKQSLLTKGINTVTSSMTFGKLSKQDDPSVLNESTNLYQSNST